MLCARASALVKSTSLFVNKILRIRMFSLLKETGFSTKELSAAGEAEHSVIKGFRIKMREVNPLLLSDAIAFPIHFNQ